MINYEEPSQLKLETEHYDICLQNVLAYNHVNAYPIGDLG